VWVIPMGVGSSSILWVIALVVLGDETR
jgi:hypothetical protein